MLFFVAGRREKLHYVGMWPLAHMLQLFVIEIFLQRSLR